MHRSKAFFKKTRRGKIHRVVSDHYLRDDIGCGSLAGKPVSKVRYEMDRDFVKYHKVDILSYVVEFGGTVASEMLNSVVAVPY